VIYSTILDSIQLMEVASQGIKPKPPPREEAQPSFDVLLRLMHAIPQVKEKKKEKINTIQYNIIFQII
jgi:hypothetical protein